MKEGRGGGEQRKEEKRMGDRDKRNRKKGRRLAFLKIRSKSKRNSKHKGIFVEAGLLEQH